MAARLSNPVYRVLQGLRQLDPRVDAGIDSTLRQLLPAPQWRLVARLSPGDRRHALSVHQGLVRAGWSNPDLLTAALLHDVGKVDDTGRSGPAHRTVKVLLGKASPKLLQRMARENTGWLCHGLFLSLHHATIGAEMARNAGANDRVCWLIAHHDDGTITGDLELLALQQVDSRE